MKALLYLEYRSLVNSTKATLRSIKSAVPAVLGILILAMFIAGAIIAGAFVRGTSHQQFPHESQVLKSVQSVVFLILTLITVQTVIQAFRGSSIAFSLAQIDFTFPSPIPRRQVLSVHLLKGYLSMGMGLLLLLLIIMPVPLGLMDAGLFPGVLITWSAIIMLYITITNIAHTINVVLTYRLETLLESGKKMKMLMGAAAFVCILLLLWLGSSIPREAITEIQSGSPFGALESFTQSRITRAVLFPVTWATDLALSPVLDSGSSLVLEFAGLVILAAASFAVLVRRRENIYEPSLGLSMKFAKMQEARKKGYLMTAITADRLASESEGKIHKSPVPPFGRGAMAIIWKNAVVAVRMSKPAQLAYFIIIMAVFIGWRSRMGSSDSDPGMWIVYIVIMGLQMMLTEVRKELKQSILKVMPIRGWKVILALATSQSIQIILLVMVLALVMGGVTALNTSTLLWILVVPSLAFAFAAAGNLAVLIYPTRNFLSSIVALVLGSIPVIASTGASAILNMTHFQLSIYVIAAAVVPFNLALGTLYTAFAGKLYDKFDVTSD